MSLTTGSQSDSKRDKRAGVTDSKGRERVRGGGRNAKGNERATQHAATEQQLLLADRKMNRISVKNYLGNSTKTLNTPLKGD